MILREEKTVIVLKHLVLTNQTTRAPFKTHHEDEDVFVHYNQSGRVDAYIKCSNVRIDSAPCQHTFSLEPRVKAQVYLHYRRGMLPEWKRIQHQVVHLIENWEFKTDRYIQTTDL